MSANFTPEQIRIQGIAADCRAEGFTGLADALEKIAAQPSLDELLRSGRKCYGKFKLNEADECTLEVVEYPIRKEAP